MDDNPEFMTYPLCWGLDNVVGVANSNGGDDLHPDSNYGGFVDLAAPGTVIHSTYLGHTYGWGTGTSYAAPLVSGVAALVKAMRPNMNAIEIKDYLVVGTDFVPALYGLVQSNGRLNAASTLQSLPPMIGGSNVGGGNQGLEDGSALHPFAQVADGAAAVAEGGQLIIQNDVEDFAIEDRPKIA